MTDDHDPVTRPAHYRWLPGDIEVIDLTEGMGFCMGNVVKYVLRADHKGSPVEDLKKARWYLDREIARREGGVSPVDEVNDIDFVEFRNGLGRLYATTRSHDKMGQLDRSVCFVCNDAYIECSGCEAYYCACTRDGICE